MGGTVSIECTRGGVARSMGLRSSQPQRTACAKAARNTVWNRSTVAGFRPVCLARNRYRSSTTFGVTFASG